MTPSIVRALAAGTAVGVAAASADTTARYNCADTLVTADFRDANGGSVTLAFEGSVERMELPQAMSADGGRYAKGDVEFWVTGNTARYTAGGVATNCEAVS